MSVVESCHGNVLVSILLDRISSFSHKLRSRQFLNVHISYPVYKFDPAPHDGKFNWTRTLNLVDFPFDKLIECLIFLVALLFNRRNSWSISRVSSDDSVNRLRGRDLKQ